MAQKMTSAMTLKMDPNNLDTTAEDNDTSRDKIHIELVLVV